ncbi:MAG TPA: MFS transporter [Trebonia sp.]|nr:MFS transporter [Trebonia sp.]
MSEVKFKSRSKSFRTAAAFCRSKYFTKRLAVLRVRDFRLFYVGYATSQFGTAMSAVAIAFAFLGTGGTATGLGVVFTANIVPMVVFLLVGGALADRLGRRRVMLAADLVRCAAQGTLAAALALGHAGLWLFVAAALAVGAGNAFFSPALSALPVQLTPTELLADANALLGTAEPAAKVAGPALAGILIAVTSPALVIAVDAATYAVSAVALARLRLGEGSRGASPRGGVAPRDSAAPRDPGQPRKATGRRDPQRNSLLGDLAEGWAEFTSHPWLWPQTVQFALFNLVTWGPYLVLGPVLADQYLGGARAWGTVLACYGGGAILGGLLALGRRPQRPLLIGTLTTFGFALPPLAFALRLPLTAVAAATLAAGLSTAFGGAFATTVEQRLISPEALSRVGAINMVGAFAFGPVAFIAAGPEAAAFGPRAVLAFGAAWSAAMTLAVLASPAIRQLPWPEPPEPTSPADERP